MDQLLSDAMVALRTLDDEVKSDRGLIRFLDNFELIASAFDALLIPRRRWRLLKKAKPLHSVLKAIGGARDQELATLAKQLKLPDLANRLKLQTKKIRQAEYRGFGEDTSDLIGDANDLREELRETLARLLPRGRK